MHALASRPRRGRTPFKASDHGTARCLDLFEAHMRLRPDLLGQVPGLTGRKLACHCQPGARCHGDVLQLLYLEYLQSLALAIFCKICDTTISSELESPLALDLNVHRKGESNGRQPDCRFEFCSLYHIFTVGHPFRYLPSRTRRAQSLSVGADILLQSSLAGNMMSGLSAAR